MECWNSYSKFHIHCTLNFVMNMTSVTNEFTYDVFLSFRGEDTRHGFTGNLWKALKDRGIHTFMDDEELRKGEEITPSLINAIQDSHMAIVVLSNNYATSSFCLQELSTILDSIKDNGRCVLPVFYKVDPSDIRKLKRSYGKAMAEHEKRPNSNMDLLQKWKNALNQVANLSGFDYKGDEYEHVFIEMIVEQVSREIIPVTLSVPDYLVGLKYPMQNVTSLLNVGSDDKVHMVGIHGIGGIGKTTLGLAVYNSIADRFEGLCFLENVRANSEKHGLSYLQKILLSEIVGENKIELTSVKKGITIIQQRFRKKKVLLLLDDVDKEEQLHAIAGSPDWFGLGSRVIITTRNKKLLTSHGVESTYEVKELSKKDAFELLRQKAFNSEKVSSGYENVLNCGVTYASGLPLALEVIGSFFYNKTIEECKDALSRYERVPHEKIQTTLRLSFDALQDEEKSVFLDIACCFKGYKLTRVEQILHAHHGDIVKNHINVLVEKSLIKISEPGNVTLHDLVEDMGKEIVRQESPGDPGQRSRLWSSKDIKEVLEENKGTSKIEIIHFDCWIRVEWDGEAFKKMTNLRTLIFSNDVGFSKHPKHLPNSIRVFECRHSRRFYDNLSNLFEWEGFLTKKFRNMRVLNLDYSDCLTQIPDISGLRNLEEFSIQHCWKLVTIDKSIGFLGKLKIFRLISCTKIRSVPPLNLASLEELEISGCYFLESFPLIVNGFVGKLKILRVTNCTKIRIIPSLMLPSLEELDLSDCTSLESFSHVVDGFGDKLKTMSFRRCIKLWSIPPLKLDSLETLDLSCCYSLENFPIVVDGFLGKLKTLLVESCHNLKSIPPLKLDSLEKLDLSYCCSLESFPSVVNGLLDKLKFLNFEYCIRLRNIPRLRLTSLEHFNLSHCYSLESFPEILGDMRNIPGLLLDETPIKELPFPFQSLTHTQPHAFCNCQYVRLPTKVVNITDMVESDIKNRTKVCPLQSSHVKYICVRDCKLSDKYLLLNILLFANVKELHLTNIQFTVIPKSIEKCHFLWKIVLDDCKKLQEIKGIPPCLRMLSALNCVSLTLSRKSKLLNQELHEAGNTWFRLPRAKIPEWFDHQCSAGLSISFWFRNKFPAIALCVVSTSTWCRSRQCVRVIINGNIFFNTHGSKNGAHSQEARFHLHLFHLHLFHLQMENFNDNMDKALLENKWNHAEVDFGFKFHKSGIHVLKERSNMKDIRFTNPEYDANIMNRKEMSCELLDEFLSINLTLFCNVKELHLTNSQCTVIPKSIEKCHFLWKLVLDDCKELEEVKGIPPCLRMLSALNCILLTSSCKSKLLNQKLHEVGNTWFRLPRAKIPEWFDHQCPAGLSIHFWVRNKFPAIVVGVVSPLTWHGSRPRIASVIINGNTFFYTHGSTISTTLILPDMYHLHIFHMKMENFNDNMDKALLENKWNYVVVDFGFPFMYSGIHVLKENKNPENDIRFTNPENDPENGPENDANIVFTQEVEDKLKNRLRFWKRLCQTGFARSVKNALNLDSVQSRVIKGDE